MISELYEHNETAASIIEAQLETVQDEDADETKRILNTILSTFSFPENPSIENHVSCRRIANRLDNALRIKHKDFINLETFTPGVRKALEKIVFALQTRGKIDKTLTPEEKANQFFSILETRLHDEQRYYERPDGVNFPEVKKALEASPDILRRLINMEETGGEPDIVSHDNSSFYFYDCSQDAPRRNQTYEEAIKMGKKLGLEMTDVEEYLRLQKIGAFDEHSKSWLKAPIADYSFIDDEELISCLRAKIGYREWDILKNKSNVKISENDPSEPSEEIGWRSIVVLPKVK